MILQSFMKDTRASEYLGGVSNLTQILQRGKGHKHTRESRGVADDTSGRTHTCTECDVVTVWRGWSCPTPPPPPASAVSRPVDWARVSTGVADALGSEDRVRESRRLRPAEGGELGACIQRTNASMNG